ncbi:MAG: hypothetical protein M3071_13595 [Actinomycetota bacterium]|nr:hypothetical protein [Actinomycetota bacterium]
MSGIQDLFWPVLWIVTGLSAVVALIALVSSGKPWEEFGRGRLVMDRDSAQAAGPQLAASPAALRERDEEIREFLAARNERRRRRGEALMDVEAELRRLTAPQVRECAIDDGIRAEIRDLVIARNHRRARAGKPQLDVEAEIEREIAQLGQI